jgi:hypothetical protein
MSIPHSPHTYRLRRKPPPYNNRHQNLHNITGTAVNDRQTNTNKSLVAIIILSGCFVGLLVIVHRNWNIQHERKY